jgi:hypothetical protein
MNTVSVFTNLYTSPWNILMAINVGLHLENFMIVTLTGHVDPISQIYLR